MTVHNRGMSFIKGKTQQKMVPHVNFFFLWILKVLCPHIEYKPLHQYQSNILTSFFFLSQTAFAEVDFFFFYSFNIYLYMYI